MKKLALTLVAGLLISFSALAQSKAEKKAGRVLAKLQTVIELTEEEQEKYIEIQTVRFTDRAAMPKDLKESNPDEFKAKNRENRKKTEDSIIAAFGEERGKEILAAGKKDRKKKKK